MRMITMPPAIQMAVRVLWIAARLLLVLWVGKRGTHFYYQGF